MRPLLFTVAVSNHVYNFIITSVRLISLCFGVGKSHTTIFPTSPEVHLAETLKLPQVLQVRQRNYFSMQ